MSTTTITPTPGRIVWYRDADNKIRAAIIVAVFGDFCVNLYVFGQTVNDPEHGYKESVTHADPEQEPSCFPSWHWMPYQKVQAEKAEAACLSVASDREADDKRWRAGMLEMALRTPGLMSLGAGHQCVIDAAIAYQAHIEGEKTLKGPQLQVGAAHASTPASSWIGLTFGDALVALKGGATVARAGWNGSGQWIALGKGNDLLAASQFWNPHARAHAEQNGGGAAVRPYFILKTAQNDILMGWSPSQSDALAEDWLIVSGEVGAAHVSA